MFNPLVILDLSKEQIGVLADELGSFGFQEFSPHFILQLKAELEEYMNLAANTKGDWGSLPGAKAWAEDIANQGRGCWKASPLEVARHVWEWWRLHRAKHFYLQTAVRLIMLVQVSSCSVERVFSRLRLILMNTQTNVNHDAVLLHIFSSVNRKYHV
jgi:hypothetical protein